MSILNEAKEILAQVKEALEEDDLTSLVTATIAPEDIRAILQSKVAVLITPGKIDWPTWAIEDVTWNIDVISGPSGSTLKAWEAMEPVIQSLRRAGLADSAEPSGYQLGGGSEYASFTITYASRS